MRKGSWVRTEGQVLRDKQAKVRTFRRDPQGRAEKKNAGHGLSGPRRKRVRARAVRERAWPRGGGRSAGGGCLPVLPWRARARAGSSGTVRQKDRLPRRQALLPGSLKVQGLSAR